MTDSKFPILKGDSLFRKNELIYVNKSDELQEFTGIIHKHDFIEINYVISGKGYHIVGEHEYVISKGDLFIINYDVPHGFFPLKGSNEDPLVYDIIFMPQFLDVSLFSYSNFHDFDSSFLFKSYFPKSIIASPDINLQGTDFNEIGDLFSKMYLEYKFKKKGYCDIIRAYLIELFIKIFRYMDKDNSQALSVKNKELIDKALEYLRQNFNTEIKLEDISMKSFISKNYFSKLFKEVTGINFSDYLQKLRIDEVCSLLRSTDMKVVDIALKSGFNDITSFYDVFKKHTGFTPGDYRKIRL